MRISLAHCQLGEQGRGLLSMLRRLGGLGKACGGLDLAIWGEDLGRGLEGEEVATGVLFGFLDLAIL
jgi:hypothetical protein